jgi:hypothetical protein
MEEYELTPTEIQQLYGKHKEDPYWLDINQQLKTGWEHAHKSNQPQVWLEYYIQVTERSIEYYQNKPKLVAINPDFYLIYDFLQLSYYHGDIKYWDILRILIGHKIESELIVFLSKLLEGLIALKDGKYNPIDEFTKKRIRKQWWDYNAKKNCTELYYRDFDSV